MSTLSAIADVLSILGFVVSLVTIWIATRVKRIVVRERDRLIRRIRIEEVRRGLLNDLKQLGRLLHSDDVESAMTLVHRVDADLATLAKHGMPELTDCVSAAQGFVNQLRSAPASSRRSVLEEMRNAVTRTAKVAENLEKDLAWSDHHDRR